MKKSIFKFLNVVAFSFVVISLTTSCGSDEPPIIIEEPTSEVIKNLNSGVMNGSLDEDFTLNASTIYNLNSSFIV